MKNRLLLFCLMIAANLGTNAQFTHADSLRGTYGASRNWWDALKYDIHIAFNIPDSSIKGYNIILYIKLMLDTTF